MQFVGWGLLLEGQVSCQLTVQPPARQLRSTCEAGWIVRDWEAAPVDGTGVTFTLLQQQAQGRQPAPATMPTTTPPTATLVSPIIPPTATMLVEPTTTATQVEPNATPTQIAATATPPLLTIAVTTTIIASSTITLTATPTAATVMLADTRPYLEQPPSNVTAAVGLSVEVRLWTATPLPLPTSTPSVSAPLADRKPTSDPRFFGWLHLDLWLLLYVAIALATASGVLGVLIHKKIIDRDKLSKKLQLIVTNLKQRTGKQAQP